MTRTSEPTGPTPTQDEMDALRDVAFHHPVEARMAARLERLRLIELARGVWGMTKEGRARLVQGAS